ncbi:hypothetical protein [Streptomyces sp. NBC_00096]|uniref:hypothetical protein n=1 Tax=Streptomyces sp. NBC_00096 TaxID=2975650 RepID=UPI00324FA95D
MTTTNADEQVDTGFRDEAVRTAEALASQPLGPYTDRPSRETVNALVTSLIRHGTPLTTWIAAIPQDDRSPQADNGLTDWGYLIDRGPPDGLDHDHAQWNHARGIARVIENLAEALREARPVSAG